MRGVLSSLRLTLLPICRSFSSYVRKYSSNNEFAYDCTASGKSSSLNANALIFYPKTIFICANTSAGEIKCKKDKPGDVSVLNPKILNAYAKPFMPMSITNFESTLSGDLPNTNKLNYSNSSIIRECLNLLF